MARQLSPRNDETPKAQQVSKRADEVAERRLRAEACRRLADPSEEAELKTWP